MALSINSIAFSPTYFNVGSSTSRPSPIKYALGVIFFSSIIQTVEASFVSYAECWKACIGNNPSARKALFCAAVCSAVLIVPN